MNATPHIPDLTAVVDRLVASLDQELTEITRLNEILAEQMVLLRERAYVEIESRTQLLNAAIRAATEARESHVRQAALLGRLLKLESDGVTLKSVIEHLSQTLATSNHAQRLQERRLQLRAQILSAGQRVAAFEFALGYASRVGRDLLGALHELMQPPSKRVYTAGGQTLRTHGARPLLNQVG